MTEKTEINVLGCGSSFGVPLSHDIWGNCDKSNPKNQRTRPSIFLKKAGKSILIDTSPDLRKQLIDNKIDNVGSVLYTHSHADHIHGISVEIEGFKIEVIRQNHGNIDSYGFIFDNKIAYNLDIKFFYDENYLDKIKGIECWFVGCLRYDEHPSHASYKEVIDWAQKVNANKTFLSHMTAHIDYNTEYRKLSAKNIFPAYDGLKLEI